MNPALYAQNLRDYAQAVRNDIDAILEALDSGQELDPDKVAMYQRAIVILNDGLKVYLEAQAIARSAL